MTEPKAYPPNDAAEQQSRAIFEGLIDSRFVKSDIRIRDKYPNIDGNIDLVNENTVLVGRFDIQLRTISKGQTSYSCETSLVAYSKVSTLPVLLICVDPDNRTVYWRHINAHMPELKDKLDQKTFTIHFSKESDSIDQTGLYRRRWMEIAGDYQECIAKYPLVSGRDAKTSSLDSVQPAERETFQRFIDTINNLLDNDFIVFKEIIFPGIWKLGVGIVSSDDYHIQYQIYSIPYKDPSPLVCKLRQGFLFTNRWSKNAVTEIRTSKEHLIDPVKAGKEFVTERIIAALKSQLLPIYGHHLSSDILFSFVDLYHSALGIQPGMQIYAMRDLSIALNQSLVNAATAALAKGIPVTNYPYDVDIGILSHYARENKIEINNQATKPFYFSIGTDNFPIRSAFDALKYLVANEVIEITRAFGLRDLPFGPGKNWIWSGYSLQNEINSVTHILRYSVNEYKTFVEGNRLRLNSSPYLNPDIAVVYEYEPAHTQDFGPGLKEHFIDNPSRRLPKLSIFIKDEQNRHVDATKFPTILVEGNSYTSSSSASMIADFFFQRNPFLTFIYRMLKDDLSKQYGIPRSSFGI